MLVSDPASIERSAARSVCVIVEHRRFRWERLTNSPSSAGHRTTPSATWSDIAHSMRDRLQRDRGRRAEGSSAARRTAHRRTRAGAVARAIARPSRRNRHCGTGRKDRYGCVTPRAACPSEVGSRRCRNSRLNGTIITPHGEHAHLRCWPRRRRGSEENAWAQRRSRWDQRTDPLVEDRHCGGMSGGATSRPDQLVIHDAARGADDDRDANYRVMRTMPAMKPFQTRTAPPGVPRRSPAG
jgi:hypothetical protein